MDWAVDLFDWFEYWLKGNGNMPELNVQMQRNDGKWHVEDTWPPEDMFWEDITLDQASSDGSFVSANSQVTLTIPASDSERFIAGLPTLHLSVSTRCDGGQIFATMFDATENLRIGHATMDVRYRDGGYTAKTVTPFSTYKMQMEFNPIDAVIPAGHEISLVLSESGEDYLPSPCATFGLQVNLDSSSTLSLPLIERSDNAAEWFDVPNWWDVEE